MEEEIDELESLGPSNRASKQEEKLLRLEMGFPPKEPRKLY